MGQLTKTFTGALSRLWNGSVRASTGSVTFTGMDDPKLLEFIRSGQVAQGGSYQLRNMAVLRCVSLICGTIGMLPTNLIVNDSRRALAKDHPAYRLLKRRPNPWQTPIEFKRQMQLSMLRHGDGYARIVRSGGRPIHLVPLDSTCMTAELGSDWRMRYTYATKTGDVSLRQEDVLHLRDMSIDGVTSLSRMKLADKAIRLALSAENAASRVFETGNMAGGSIEVPSALSDTAYDRMRASLDTEYAGERGAQRLMLLEEGAKANWNGSTSKDAQHVENRNAQVEEVARLFGVPRPLLMMDDTSWGSGIEQLGIFFVQYTMLEHFTNWEQSLMRSLLSEAESEQYQWKFNERALMRGTLNDQATFFSKALGAGGTSPWYTQNEVRDLSDMPESTDPAANELRNPMTQKGQMNEPAKPA